MRILLMMATCLLLACFSSADEGDSFWELAELAKNHDSGVAFERSSADADKEAESQAFGELLPQLSFSVQNAWNQAGRESKQRRQSLQLSQILFNAPAMHRYEGTRYAAQAREHAYEEAAQSLLLDVIEARLSIHVAADRLALLRKRKENIASQLELTTRREAGGIDTYLDVVLVEAELEGVAADIEEASKDWLGARRGLLRLTGRKVESLPRLRSGFSPSFLPDLNDLLAKSEKNNPSLQAGRMRLAQIKEEYQSVVSEWKPTVNLVASQNLDDWEEESSMVAIRMDLRLYSGGSLHSRFRQAGHRLSSARHSLTDVRRRLDESMRNLHGDIKAAAERVRSLDAAISARKISLDKNRIAWREGVRLAADVLKAEEDLFESELRRNQLVYNYLASWARMQSLADGIDKAYLDMLDSFFE